jgi:mRNA-degrading endonuclease toxin of MazEF toxin-antitoxin module
VTALRRGLLYWGRLDKRRPVLVVSSDRFNSRAEYATVVPGSTRLRPLVTHVRLAPGEGGVARPTMLLCEHVQEIHASDVDATALGEPLSRTRMAEVEAALSFYLELGADDEPG